MRNYAMVTARAKTKRSGIKKICLALFVAVTIGCASGKLDRRMAATKISEQMATLGTVQNVYIGRIGAHCGLNPATRHEWAMDPDKEVGIVVAVKAGYVTVIADGQDFWKVNLSAKGQGAGAHEIQGMHITLRGCDYTTMAFPVAKPVLVKITGILADNNSAVAEYEWKWELTELGRTLRENGSTYAQLSEDDRDLLRTLFMMYDPVLPVPVPPDAESNFQQGKATFIKYDDGWRLKLP